MNINVKLKRLGIYSPLRYPGGKSSMAGVLSQFLSATSRSINTVIEPYAGGAGAALSLLFLERIERIVINDLDPAVFSFWRAITESPDWMIDQIDRRELTIDEWRRQRLIYTNQNYDNFLE